MSEWQPMDTAPKNQAGKIVGPQILVFVHEGNMQVVRWGQDIYGDPEWIDCSRHAVDPERWMPLPEPPHD